ncbi:MAG: tetratricopeptide repeat protein [Deltaproteobacteria bacterium]|nr:tetratricopeptide repeat protein [Deltaproteobacteria bacterium]
MRVATTMAAFALLLAVTATAVAQESVQARDLFNEAVVHFDSGRYEDAATAFRNAYELQPSWKLLYNIGQCEAALKHYGLAIDSFEHYLSEGGDEVPIDRRDEVLEELDRLRKMVGTVLFDGPDGVTVTVDGYVRGSTPIPAGVLVSAGIPHRFEVEREGEVVFDRTLKVRGGMTVTIRVPQGDSGEEAEVVPSGADSVVGADGDEELSQAIFWACLGATAALGAVTLAMSFGAESKYDDATADPSNQNLKDEGKTMQAVGITFLALTGAAAITTGILAAFTDFGGDDEASAEVDLSLAPWGAGSGGGLVLEGRF